MNREIIQQIVEELQELELKSIEKGIKERNIGDLNICFREGILKIGCKVLKEIYERIDEELFIKNKKNHLYQVVKKDSKTLVTSLGEVKFTRRFYKNKKGQTKYLFDKYLKIRKGARYTVDAEARAMEEVIETSYRKGGKNASITSSLSKVTMMNMLKT